MPLLTLPNETLLHIIDHLSSPRDLLTFALISHRQYNLCHNILLRHQELYAHYRNLELRPGTALYQILLFLRNPHLRIYPRNLDLGEYGPDFIPDTEFWPASDAEVQELKPLLLDHRSWVDQEYMDVWLGAISEGDEAPLAALLPTLLPNLRNVKWARLEDSQEFLYQILGSWRDPPDEYSLSEHEGNGIPVREVCDTTPGVALFEASGQKGVFADSTCKRGISDVTNGPGSMGRLLPDSTCQSGAPHSTTPGSGRTMFGNLQEVTVVPTHPHERAPDLNLMVISPFLALPALKKMYAERVLGLANTPEVCLPPSSQGVCGLETLALEKSNVNSESLGIFLRPIRNLKSFSYSLDKTLFPWVQDWANIPRVLQTQVGHSLESLCLELPHLTPELMNKYTLHDNSPHSNANGPHQNLINYDHQGFKKLREVSITIDDTMEILPSDPSWRSSIYGISWLLLKFLPPCIESFQLVGKSMADRHVRTILGSVAGDNGYRMRVPDPFPSLRKVVIHGEQGCRPFNWEGSGWTSLEHAILEYLRPQLES
ncbi:MAG: hypothetical protein Q9218_002276 [Villophora microphyllina]